MSSEQIVRTGDITGLESVRAKLAHLGPHPTEQQISHAISAQNLAFGDQALAALTSSIYTEVSGGGPLQSLLEDPGVTDVLVNGPAQVWIDRGGGMELSGVDLGSDQDLRMLAVRLAAMGGTRLDDAQPMVDARLPDGSRLHAVLHPLCEPAALISLRTLRARPFTLTQLVVSGTVPQTWEPVLRALISRRVNFLISGATGSGKTTLLATLLGLVNYTERIITIEESRELRPTHPHVVGLETKRSNVEGIGEVDQAMLVRNALRMRPDRLVLGECRGQEVRDMLGALNTGHEGGCATIHANSAQDIPARLEALGALAGMDRLAIAAQAASAIDVLIHVRTVASGDKQKRIVGELALLRRNDAGFLITIPALIWSGHGKPQIVGPAGNELLARFGLMPTQGPGDGK